MITTLVYRKFYTIHLFLFIGISYCHAQYDSIPFDDVFRTYLLHLPTDYSEYDTLPLIVSMHGGFGSALNLEEQSGLSAKADMEKFIVVYPEGIKSVPLGIRTWNAGWCCGYASNMVSDDVGFINTLLDTLESKYNIDTLRIYATGMSNGGFMTYRLACELSDRIAAFAPVAASMSMTECEPLRSVPIIHFHSYQDSSIPYTGGVGDGVSDHYNPPADSVHNAFANHNNCKVFNDTIIHTEQYTFIKWTNCDNYTEIHYYITQDGGHSWPGGVQTTIGDPVSEYIKATDLMWTFFENYSLDYRNTNTLEKTLKKSPVLFPNPTTGLIQVKIDPEIKDFTIIIYNTEGRQIKKLINQKQINLFYLPEGIYYTKIVFWNRVVQKKIILIK